MKKLLFLLITLCTSLSMAQSFIITKDGFVNEDTNQDFVVIESNGKSQKGMFEAVKSGINKVLLSNFLSFRYKIEFSFKDNAVKIQITYIDIIGYKKVMYFKKESGKEYDKNVSFLVKENGKIRSYERGLLEDFSDDIISETKRAIKQAW